MEGKALGYLVLMFLSGNSNLSEVKRWILTNLDVGEEVIGSCAIIQKGSWVVRSFTASKDNNGKARFNYDDQSDTTI